MSRAGSPQGADVRGPLLQQAHLPPSASPPGPPRPASGGGQSCANTCGGTDTRRPLRPPGGPQAAWDADSSERCRGQGYVNRRSKPKSRWPFSVINVCPLCATALRPPSSLPSLGFTGTREETHPCGFGGLSFRWLVSLAVDPPSRQTAPCIFKAQPACVTPPKQGGQGAGSLEAFIVQSQLGDSSPTAWEPGACLVQSVPIVPGPPKTTSVSLGKGNLMGRGTERPGVLRVIKPSSFQQLFLPGFATHLGSVRPEPMCLGFYWFGPSLPYLGHLLLKARK